MGTIWIPLHGKDKKVVAYAQIDEDDYEIVSPFKWHLRPDGYASTCLPRSFGMNRRARMHRLILGAPTGVEVDHIDHDRLNNTRANLRLCTRSQNHMNRRPPERHLPVGVHVGKKGKGYRAVIKVNQKQIEIGNFPTLEEAVSARAKATNEHHGEFSHMSKNAMELSGNTGRQ